MTLEIMWSIARHLVRLQPLPDTLKYCIVLNKTKPLECHGNIMCWQPCKNICCYDIPTVLRLEYMPKNAKNTWKLHAKPKVDVTFDVLYVKSKRL